MEAPKTPSTRPIKRPRGGVLHVLGAARYSAAGLRRLLRETAARLEVVGAGVVALAFVWRDVEVWHWFTAVVFLALILAIEALNTAVEILTDRLSPEWSQMAKDAKDLGSLAVGLVLVVAVIFVALVLLGLL